MDDRSRQADERARTEAAAWFARLRGPAASASRPAFDAWRTADPRNEAAYARIAQRWDQAALLRHTAVGRAHELPEGRPRMAWLSSRSLFAPALVGIALLLAAVLVISDPFSSATRQHADFATRVGEIRTVPLPDGSRVTLDTASALTLAYTPAERRLRLGSGRARFEVVADASRPFVVETEGGSVVARGTVFDVSVRDGRIDVTLLEGAVDVQIRHRNPSGQVAPFVERLRPGQKLTFDDSSPRLAPTPAPIQEAQWISGLLAYDGARLDHVIGDANRYTVAKIRLSDPALGALRVTGVFRASRTTELANSLAATFDLTAVKTKDGDIMLRPTPDKPSPQQF